MDPITIGLIATGALGKLGSIFGQKKRKQLSPQELKQMFGAKAVTDEQMELFNRAMGSAQGQELMTNAAQTGQQYQTDVARRSAEAGLGPSGGASSGADVFAGAAADSAVNNLQRSTRASMMEAMLPVAQQLVSDRMNAWLSDREKALGQTSRFQDVMGTVADLSGNLLASKQAADATKDNQTTQTASAQPSGMAPQPSGAAPLQGAQPPGAGALVNPPSQLAMPHGMAQANMPGSRDKAMRMMLQGGGRFARAMTNRFGAVQPAYGGM